MKYGSTYIPPGSLGPQGAQAGSARFLSLWTIWTIFARYDLKSSSTSGRSALVGLTVHGHLKQSAGGGGDFSAPLARK